VGLLALLAGLILERDSLLSRFEGLTAIRQVRVEGTFDGLEPEIFAAAVRPGLQGSFFLLDLDALERRAREVPWVGQVEVRRVWPDTVVFSIEELEPIAQWGDQQLISANGEVFDRPDSSYDFLKMPWLHGPRGRENELLAMRQQLDERLSRQGLRVNRLLLSERLAWTASLSNGLQITYGNQPPLEATDRLIALLPALQRESDRPLSSVDLRYPRGFAVSFKPALPAREPPLADDREG
jgi:cell division protein FtsQ